MTRDQHSRPGTESPADQTSTNRRISADNGTSSKPPVPLEEMVDNHATADRNAAGDQLASEAAKAPTPYVEGPFEVDHVERGSVSDLVDSDRRKERRRNDN